MRCGVILAICLNQLDLSSAFSSVIRVGLKQATDVSIQLMYKSEARLARPSIYIASVCKLALFVRFSDPLASGGGRDYMAK